MEKELTYSEYLDKVHKGILTDAGNCPVTPLLLMLQGKWKFQIIYELCIKDPIRFGELKKMYFRHYKHNAHNIFKRIRKGRTYKQNTIQ